MVDDNADDWVDVKAESRDRKQKPDPSHLADEKKEYAFYVVTAESALARLNQDASPIFLVDVSQDTLWSTWLDNLDPSLRHEYSCTTCRRFIKRYGGLAQVDSQGAVQPLLWDPTERPGPDHFRASIKAIYDKVSSATVSEEFKVIPRTKSIGTRTSGGYNHFYVDFPEARIRKKEARGFESAPVTVLATMIGRVIDDYSLKTIRQAFTILTEDKLPHADSHKAAIRWFLPLRENKRMEEDSDKTTRQNLLYLHAAISFRGCVSQLRSGALSTLLQDIEAGKDFTEIKEHWSEVNDPARYLRPQAAPKAGQLLAAELLMESLGITSHDLRRRDFTMSELPEQVIMFMSAARKNRVPTAAKPGGIFSTVKPKPRNPQPKPAPLDKTGLSTPPTRISFTKFVTDILPKAVKIEYMLERCDPITFLITGYEGTKPLMQWHNDENHNRVSWFQYTFPPPVTEHNLLPDDWNEVACILPAPYLWDGIPLTTTFPLAPADSTDFKYYHKKRGFQYMLCLEGVRLDKVAQSCLFPSFLKSEFHGARSAIEAYSTSHPLEKVPNIEEKGGIVAGVRVSRSQDMDECKHLLRVTDEKGDINTYRIALFE
ncbi:hypothetical protein G647_03590 [Cladophialophora carrionii CBS 160.54]|uniref:Uncharacterized protein n=1 Tax=Cladophialophora carrionii CBS 160.54 TaxID=1279043 RepID=V9DBY7_9EURO|nr:uncharacterized protein G647_03590 [Cladophialophora carrionii CBS 160.54]ETI24221.1 hypothetical protein G647_03590 [Cladophialophora carrionii CBS 160.54]